MEHYKDQGVIMQQPKQQLSSLPSKQIVEESYRKNLEYVQSQLPPLRRAFSKIIHSRAGEYIWEVVARIFMRPLLIVAASLGALAGLILYLVARYYGYRLSGAEVPICILLGWSVGVVIEFARVGCRMLRRRPDN